MEDELAAFQTDGSMLVHALAGHDLFDLFEREMLDRLLPDVAVLAARLACSG